MYVCMFINCYFSITKSICLAIAREPVSQCYRLDFSKKKNLSLSTFYLAIKKSLFLSAIFLAITREPVCQCHIFWLLKEGLFTSAISFAYQREPVSQSYIFDYFSRPVSQCYIFDY